MKDTEKATLQGFETIQQTKECILVFTFLSQNQPNRERIRVLGTEQSAPECVSRHQPTLIRPQRGRVTVKVDDS